MRAGACSSRNDRRASTWPGAGTFRAVKSATVRTSSRLLRAGCARSSGATSAPALCGRSLGPLPGRARRGARGGGHCSAVYNALKAHSRRQSMAAPTDLPEIQLDSKALYREDVFTDRRAGSIRRLTPVTADGAPDPTRHVLFSGQTQLLTPARVLPLGFEIEAATLEEALKKFPA